MKRNISYKKGLWPAPVYEAHFADNTVGRMSFWTQAGKPINFEAGRKMLEKVYGKIVKTGYVEQDEIGKPWSREVDPLHTSTDKPARITAKRALRELLAALETPDADLPAALAQARKLAA